MINKIILLVSILLLVQNCHHLDNSTNFINDKTDIKDSTNVIPKSINVDKIDGMWKIVSVSLIDDMGKVISGTYDTNLNKMPELILDIKDTILNWYNSVNEWDYLKTTLTLPFSSDSVMRKIQAYKLYIKSHGDTVIIDYGRLETSISYYNKPIDTMIGHPRLQFVHIASFQPRLCFSDSTNNSLSETSRKLIGIWKSDTMHWEDPSIYWTREVWYFWNSREILIAIEMSAIYQWSVGPLSCTWNMQNDSIIEIEGSSFSLSFNGLIDNDSLCVYDFVIPRSANGIKRTRKLYKSEISYQDTSLFYLNAARWAIWNPRVSNSHKLQE